MDKNNRIWIFKADRIVEQSTAQAIQDALDRFVSSWHSHHKPLHASARFLHRLFVLVEVDESLNIASGCAQDSLTHFIRDMGSRFGIDFFDRKSIAVERDEEIVLLSLDSLKEEISAGRLHTSTIFFNQLVANSKEFESKWRQPIGESWANNWLK